VIRVKGFIAQSIGALPERMKTDGAPRVLRSDLMTRATRELLKQALELPLDERASMAAELLESLGEAEEDVDAA
jgi:hypothetical protein